MRLSSHQTNIMLWLFLATAEGWVHKRGTKWWVWLKYLRRCIFPRDRPLGPSERASFSRSLKRLEKRGLIERTNEVSGGKQTTSIRLTGLGLEYARELTQQHLDKHPKDHLAESFKAALATDAEVNILE